MTRISKKWREQGSRIHFFKMLTRAFVYILLALVVCLVAGVMLRSTPQNSFVVKEPLQTTEHSIIDPDGSTVESRVQVPKGYVRASVGEHEFTAYTRGLPVKAHGSPVLLYNGSYKSNQTVHVAVLDQKIGTKNLHQCADAAMRIKADYLRVAGKGDEIHFDLTNGHQIDYAKWREGYRISLQGNKTTWTLKGSPSDTDDSYWQYLELIFNYAGTLSLSKELKPAPLSSIAPGHLWLQGGSPGHAVLVLDECIHNETGEKLILYAQSYMPAQETHILVNKEEPDISPWYRVPTTEVVQTPEWSFRVSDLYYFAP